MGSPFRALAPEERAIFQSVIDDLYRQFVAKLVERRHIPMDTARTIADGRIYTAEQALALHLIDRVGYMSDVIDVAQRAAGVDQARVVVYHRPRQYRATYYAAESISAAPMEQALGPLARVIGPGPRFLYLWWP